MGKKLRCNNCNNVWNYKGLNEYRASCSRCGWKVSIKNNGVKNG